MNWNIFLFGFIGAFAPEIVRLYRLRYSEPKIKCPFYYIIISFIFFVLGGIMALILSASNFYNAFYIGASLPTIISDIGKKEPRKIYVKSLGKQKDNFIFIIENIRNYFWLLFR